MCNLTDFLEGGELELWATKPCHTLGYCPYGCLVEFFDLHPGAPTQCLVFGHRCPVFRLAEKMAEEGA